MKTLMKKLKLGVLLSGLIILASCGNTSTLVSTAGINAINYGIPCLAINATKHTGYKISKYFKKSPPANKTIDNSAKNVQKKSHKPKVMPISIGVTAGARLVTSAGR